MDDLLQEFDRAGKEAFGEAGLHTRPPVRHLTIEEYQSVVRWSPKPLESNIEELDGSVVKGVLPLARRFENRLDDLVYRQRVRELPGQLRRLVRQLRHRHLGLQVLEWIESQLTSVANDEGLFRETVGPGMMESVWYIPAVDRRRVLEAFSGDAAFVSRVVELVAATKKLAHQLAVEHPWAVPLPNNLPPCTMPTSGTWSCSSWIGITSRPMPEDLPEGAHVGTARRIWSRLRTRRGQRIEGAGEEETVRVLGTVLNWGALASALTLALMATAPSTTKRVQAVIDIEECESIGGPRALPWVRYREATLREGQHDVVVAHLPPPGLAGNHFRNRYKDSTGLTQKQREVEDMGRFGPKRWKKALKKLIPELVKRTRLDGELVLFVPLAARTAERQRGRRQAAWSYLPMPELDDGVADHLEELGMEVVLNVLIEERHPIRQAVFGTQRCPWRCVVTRPRLDARDLGMGFDEDDLDLGPDSQEASHA